MFENQYVWCKVESLLNDIVTEESELITIIRILYSRRIGQIYYR